MWFVHKALAPPTPAPLCVPSDVNMNDSHQGAAAVLFLYV
jgi:hypothetical protein